MSLIFRQQFKLKTLDYSAHLRRFFFRRLRRRGRLLSSPLFKGVVALPCSFRAVAATLNSTSSPVSLLPCTGGLVSAPALGPVVAGTSLRAPPPSRKSLSTKSERIRRQSPSQVRRETAWDQKNPTPSTNHVSFEQTHCLLGRATMWVHSPSPSSRSALARSSQTVLRELDESHGTLSARFRSDRDGAASRNEFLTSLLDCLTRGFRETISWPQSRACWWITIKNKRAIGLAQHEADQIIRNYSPPRTSHLYSDEIVDENLSYWSYLFKIKQGSRGQLYSMICDLTRSTRSTMSKIYNTKRSSETRFSCTSAKSSLAFQTKSVSSLAFNSSLNYYTMNRWRSRLNRQKCSRGARHNVAQLLPSRQRTALARAEARWSRKLQYFVQSTRAKINVDPSGFVNWKSMVVSLRTRVSLLQICRATRCRTRRRTARVSRRARNRNLEGYHSSPEQIRPTTQHPVRDRRSSRLAFDACQPASGRHCARRYPWKAADGAAVMYILSERCDDSDPRIPPAQFRSLRAGGGTGAPRREAPCAHALSFALPRYTRVSPSAILLSLSLFPFLSFSPALAFLLTPPWSATMVVVYGDRGVPSPPRLWETRGDSRGTAGHSRGVHRIYRVTLLLFRVNKDGASQPALFVADYVTQFQ